MADEPELVRVTNVSTVPHTYEHRQDVSPTRAHYVWPPGESRAVPVAVADVICQAHPAKLQRLGGGGGNRMIDTAQKPTRHYHTYRKGANTCSTCKHQKRGTTAATTAPESSEPEGKEPAE
jgi:hypothetical protein